VNTLASIRRTDWFRVIVDLERSGLTQADIGRAVGRSQNQVNAYKCVPDTEPRFAVGVKLIALWMGRGGDLQKLPVMED